MPIDTLSWLLYYVAAPFLIMLAVVATVLNVTVFMSRFFVKSRSSTLEMTYSLAVTDTLSSLAQAASLFLNSFGPVVLGMKQKTWCFPMALEVFRMGFMLTGVFHIAALAFVHYLQIVRPFDHTRILSLSQTHVLLGILWIVPTLVMTIYFSSFPGAGFQAPNCLSKNPGGMYFYYNIYFRSQVSLIILTMMLATCIIYWRLLKVVDNVRQKANLPKNKNNNQMSGKSWKSSSSANRGRRTVVTATIIYGTFLFGWMPASCLFILTAEGMPLSENKKSWFGMVFFFSMMCMILKTLTNPIIYATRIPEVRNFVHRLLRIRPKTTRPTITHDETTSRRRSEHEQTRHSLLLNPDRSSIFTRENSHARIASPPPSQFNSSLDHRSAFQLIL